MSSECVGCAPVLIVERTRQRERVAGLRGDAALLGMLGPIIARYDDNRIAYSPARSILECDLGGSPRGGGGKPCPAMAVLACQLDRTATHDTEELGAHAH